MQVCTSLQTDNYASTPPFNKTNLPKMFVCRIKSGGPESQAGMNLIQKKTIRKQNPEYKRAQMTGKASDFQ